MEIKLHTKLNYLQKRKRKNDLIVSLDEWDMWEEEEEPVHTSPPPPPPPPPAAGPPNQPADGISHMSMMAKSRMQQELVAKARLRQAINLPGVVNSLPAAANSLPAAANNLPAAANSLPAAANSMTAAANSLPAAANSLPAAANNLPAAANSFTDINGEQATLESIDSVPIKADAVHDKIKVLETRLEKDKFIPLPAISPTVATTEQEETTVKQQLPPRRKLYDSLFDEKALSEKERQRRQFLFGVPSPPIKQTVQPSPPEKEPLPSCKPVAPPPSPKEKDEFPQEQINKAVSKKDDEKKPKNKCCVIL